MCKAGKSKILIYDIFSFINNKFKYILQMDVSRRNLFTKSCKKYTKVGTTSPLEVIFPIFEILIHIY